MTFWVAGAAVVGSIAGGAMAANGSKKAAATQAASADKASELQKEMFDKQVALQEPFRQGGLSAQNRLMYLLGLPQAGDGSGGAGSGGAQMLSQQSDGSYAPQASTYTAPDRNAIRNQLLSQFTHGDSGGAITGYTMHNADAPPEPIYGPSTSSVDEAGLNAAVDKQYAQQQAQQAQQTQQAQQPAQSTAVLTREQIAAELQPKFTNPAYGGNGVDDAGLNAAIDQRMAQQTQQQGGLSGAGSLMVPFGQAQYNADAAPKIGDFTAADFQAGMDPGYAFRQSEGQKELDRKLSAGGSLYSGKALKDAMTFNQGLASQEYGNAFNRFQTNRTNKLNDYTGAFNRFQTSRSNILNPLQSLMGAGQTATGQQAQYAGNYAQQAGNNIIGAGNAQAAGQVGQANAINNAIGQGVGMYQNQQAMNRLFPQSTGYSSFGSSPMSNLLYSNGSLGD